MAVVGYCIFFFELNLIYFSLNLRSSLPRTGVSVSARHSRNGKCRLHCSSLDIRVCLGVGVVLAT